MSHRVIAWADCPKGHWLARVTIRDGEPGIEYRGAIVGVTKSGRYTSTVRGALAWESLDYLRNADLESLTDGARCACGRDYVLDLVMLARGLGGPPVTVPVQHADRIDIRPYRNDMG